jgi:Zn-finger nucleic acid-binding protein
MPLLVSPIDGTTPMQQIIRDGIEIDRCPVSGGVWLDRGELEKLLGMMREAVSEGEHDFQNFKQMKHAGQIPPTHYQHLPPPPPPYGYARPHKYDDDDYEDYHKYKHGKKSKMKSILDFFD